MHSQLTVSNDYSNNASAVSSYCFSDSDDAAIEFLLLAHHIDGLYLQMFVIVNSLNDKQTPTLRCMKTLLSGSISLTVISGKGKRLKLAWKFCCLTSWLLE